MKIHFYIYGILLLFLSAGCNKIEEEVIEELPSSPQEDITGIPEGYFVATFSGFVPDTRAAVSGADTRVQHLRYLVYKSTGEFVKERVLWIPSNGTINWPFASVRDTLPKGEYKAVFLGNEEKTLFPYALPGTPQNFSEVLLNYKTNYSSARISLPNAEMTPGKEYYWARVPFSDQAPTPVVTLQRIIGLLNLHRNFVDAQMALTKLENNIVTQMHYGDLIRTTTNAVLTTQIKGILNPLSGLISSVDTITNRLLRAIVNPLVDTLNNRLLRQLTAKIGIALSANENQNGLLGVLGEALNPWASPNAYTTIVTIRNFPKSIDFDRNVQEYFTPDSLFRYDFTNDTLWRQKVIHIKGFSGLYNVRKIHVIKQGLISGLLVNGIIDNSLLLEGTFVDVTDPITNTTAGNRRYKSNYSFVDLKLKSYTAQTDGDHSLSITAKIGDIANIDGIITSIPGIGPILGLVLSPLKLITVTVPINLPLLGIENIELSGSWDIPPVAY